MTCVREVKTESEIDDEANAIKQVLRSSKKPIVIEWGLAWRFEKGKTREG